MRHVMKHKNNTLKHNSIKKLILSSKLGGKVKKSEDENKNECASSDMKHMLYECNVLCSNVS